ncbi:MAG: MATE family efflux transporter [Clostridia bacterium]|nr:MATE family efflux transporter [Clostridia bacterium]
MHWITPQTKKDATVPSADRLLFSNNALKVLIIPLIIEQLLATFVGVADGIMVAGVGEVALSAVSLVDQLSIVILNLFVAFATGGAVVSSQFIGAQNKEKARQSAGQLLLVVTVVSVLLLAVILLFNRNILTLFFGSIEPEVMTNSVVYFIITAVSYPFMAMVSAVNALFRSMGNSKVTMKTSLLMNVINVGGNALLIYGFKLGVAGAAYATLLARAVACIVSLVLLSRSQGDIYISRHTNWRPDFSIIGKIFKIGIPNGLENTVFHLGRVLVLGVVSVFGTTQIAANATASTLSTFTTVPGHAIGLAIITVVGQCVGAQDLAQSKYYMKKMLKMAYLLHCIVSLLLVLLLFPILKLYQLTPATELLTFRLVLIHALCGIFLWPMSFTIPNMLRATNDATFTMAASMFSMIVFRIGGSYILGLWLGYGAIGVWFAMVLDWICRSSFFVWRILKGHWIKKAFKTT